MKNKTLTSALVATSAIIAWPMAAHAAPVTFDEATLPDGDFSNGLDQPDILMAGFDSAIGGLTSNSDGVDSFAITGLPGGVQTFDFSFDAISSSVFYSLFIGEDSVSDLSLFTNITGDTSGSFTTSAGFEGTLFVALFGSEGEFSGFADYAISLRHSDVSEVPLPAAAPLFAAGLGGLAAARTRRKAKKRAR